jgi:cobalt/nickel transport system permease protein
MMFNLRKTVVIILGFILLVPKNLFAMHIMEGFLPIQWSIAWSIITLPFIAIGLYVIGEKVKLNPKVKILIGIAGAFAFVMSALKIPSVTGSSSHPTGVGLGSILFVPFVMSVIGCIILLFQALLLAHGGITTLGANTFSMAVAGPFISFGIYKLLNGLKSPKWLSVFLAAFFGDLVTYITTSFQLALAFPSVTGGFSESFIKFLSIFAITQIPLAASEGLITVIIFNIIYKYNKEELISLSVIKED